jgi:hypothetical protein
MKTINLIIFGEEYERNNNTGRELNSSIHFIWICMLDERTTRKGKTAKIRFIRTAERYRMTVHKSKEYIR